MTCLPSRQVQPRRSGHPTHFEAEPLKGRLDLSQGQPPAPARIQPRQRSPKVVSRDGVIGIVGVSIYSCR